MSKRRKSGHPTPKTAPDEPFAVRWHSIADPDTPSADIMSSPDPLNDETVTFLAPPSSSQRVTRSHRSARFASLGRSVSPRKQQFELEYGGGRSPQRLLVTVETEDDDAPTTGTRRRLFPSSSPFKGGAGMAATTTTVPLKESIEDEYGAGNATPRRRGRPRKTNGTPIPSAAKKRRAPTPSNRSAKRANTGRDVSSSVEPSQPTPTPKRRGRPPKNHADPPSNTGSHLELPSDTSRQTTPTPKKRGRPPKNQSVEPSSETGVGSRTMTSATKGRRRRQALAPEDLEVMVEEPEAVAEQYEVTDDDAVDLPRVQPAEGDLEDGPPPPAVQDPESDIWMNTMDEQATPRPRTRNSRSTSAKSQTPVPTAHVDVPPGAPDDMESVASQAEGFAEGFAEGIDDGARTVSDSGSIMDGPYHSATQKNDTVAQEDFSMIFMDSIQSYQELRSSKQGPAPAQSETEGIGDRIDNNAVQVFHQEAEIEGEGDADEEQIADNIAEELQDFHEDAAGNAVQDLSGDDSNEMDLIEAPEDPARDAFEEMEADLADNMVAEQDERDVAAGQQTLMEEDEIEELMAIEPVAKEDEHTEQENDVEMVQQGADGGIEQREDEPMEELHTVPELDKAAESSSSPPPADEPDERETVRTSSPVRSAGLSSKFGSASPWLSRTPRRPNVSPLRRQVLSSMTRDNSTPRASQVYKQSPLAGSSRRDESPRIAEDDSNLYEDSFSEIPEAVLTAATPGRNDRLPVAEEQQEEDAGALTAEVEMADGEPQVEELEEDDAQQEHPAELEQLEEELEQSRVEEEQHPSFGYAPASHDQAPAPSNASSVALTDNGRLPTPDDTPPNLGVEEVQPDKSTQASVASPTPDPQTQLAVEHAAISSPAQPHNDLQQPRVSVERSSSLPDITPANQVSSPMQNPPSSASQTTPEKVTRPALSAIVRAGRVLQSVTSDPPSPGDRQNQLGSPFRSSASKESRTGSREPASNRPSASPGRRSMGHQRQSASIDRLSEDPFAPKPRISTGQGSFFQGVGRSVSGKANNARSLNVESAPGHAEVEPPHEDMSWLPDAEPAQPSSPPRSQSVPDAAQSSPSQQRRSVARSTAERQDVHAERDDETDIWEIEAQRDEPESSRKESSFLSMTSAPVHRRPAIPSPWTRKSQQLAEGDTSQFAAPKASNAASRTDQAQQEDDEEGFSLLAQRQKIQEAEAANNNNNNNNNNPDSSAAKTNKFDLSSFFSSPAAIGGKLVSKFFPSRRQEEPEMEEVPAMPHSTMFPSVPQKQFEPSSEGRTDLFSSAGSQQSRQSRSPSRTPMPKAQSIQEQPDEAERHQPAQRDLGNASASPDTPERLERPISARRSNFTPRPRQTSQSFSQPQSGQLAALTPPRMQLSHEDIERWQQETSNGSEDETTSTPPQRFLRPLPPRNASPSKSAIRSPLKPHTPGRVVEFTSSVLSPIEQARQRQARQAAMIQDNEELSDGEDTSMQDAPPASSKEPKNLSKDKWSREHWLFMDKLLQHRKKQRFGIECEPRSKRFLGKTVRSNGEALRLEQWHLDCVDAFKAVVGGWDEADLVKRLFGLIKGEENRADRFAAQQQGMFH